MFLLILIAHSDDGDFFETRLLLFSFSSSIHYNLFHLPAGGGGLFISQLINSSYIELNRNDREPAQLSVLVLMVAKDGLDRRNGHKLSQRRCKVVLYKRWDEQLSLSHKEKKKKKEKKNSFHRNWLIQISCCCFYYGDIKMRMCKSFPVGEGCMPHHHHHLQTCEIRISRRRRRRLLFTIWYF